MPPGFDGPPGTEDTSLMPPPPSAPPRGPPVALMSMDLPRPQELPEEEEDEEEQGCMIGPPAPSEESISSQPSSSHNWGVPAAGYGSHQGPAQSQGPSPSPLPQDRAETMPSKAIVLRMLAALTSHWNKRLWVSSSLVSMTSSQHHRG